MNVCYTFIYQSQRVAACRPVWCPEPRPGSNFGILTWHKRSLKSSMNIAITWRKRQEEDKKEVKHMICGHIFLEQSRRRY